MRYELREVISRGGMGVIYKAYDTVMKREVALKTIVDAGGSAAAEMFQKEWALQASVIHPNIVEIHDIGDFEEDGAIRPYFVMPLLPGLTLGQLIKSSSNRLTVERSVDIICQTCRGLQAAHERGLVHRDLKPNNVFVMDDDSVKIIDFGLVHTDTGKSTNGMKGTLPYMAPELLQMQQPSVLTDIFALGAVCYETLTLRRAFEGSSDIEISQAVLRHNPPPANLINKGVSELIGRVIHKAIAKQPWHRFSSAREFGETLSKALRNEPIEFFDPSRVMPRIDRAAKAFERGEHQVAAGILSELEGEGHIDQEIIHLRRQVEQAMRQLDIRRLLTNAQQFFKEEEYSLSLRKIHEALQLDSNDMSALALQNQVESKRREKKISEYSQLAIRHLGNNAFAAAREAIQNLLELKPADSAGLEMLAEVHRGQKEYERVREQKAELYDSAVEAWQRGDVNTALTRLERWVLIERDASDGDQARLLSCQNFYHQVRSESEAIKNSYEEAKTRIAAQDFPAAFALCEQYLSKYPGHAPFQALKYDIEERTRQSVSAFIAEIDRGLESEPDIGKRYAILESALKQYPGELHFVRAFRIVRDKRDLVNSVAAQARLHEEQGRFSEALDQWDIMGAIYSQYPELDREIDRLRQRLDSQSLSNAKLQWVKQVNRYLESGDYRRAFDTVRGALAEFPGDAEITELGKLTQQRSETSAAAMALLSEGGEQYAQGHFEEGLDAMRRANAMDVGNPVISAMFGDTLAARARSLLDSDTPAADKVIGELLDLEPNHALGQTLRAILLERKREDLPVPLQVQEVQSPSEPIATPAPPPLSPAEPQPVLAAQPPTDAPPPIVAPSVPVPAPVPPPVERIPRANGLPLLFGFSCAVLALLGAGAYKLTRGRRPVVTPTVVTPAAMLRVDLRTTPPGALLTIDDVARGPSNLQLDLAPGSHRITAELEGYEPAVTTVASNPGETSAAVDLVLAALPATLRVYSDVEGSEAWLDEKPLSAVQEGEFLAETLMPGTYAFRFSNRLGRVAMVFELSPGKPPAIGVPTEVKGLELALIHQYGNRAWINCNCSPIKISLDNRPPADLSSAEIEWTGLSAGSHKLKLSNGNGERKFTFQSGQAPSVTAFVFSKPEPDTGVLSISTGEDNVSVFLNNSLYRDTTQNGRLRIANLPAAEKYTVRVSKDGYEPSTPQIVSLVKGAETKVTFQLKPVLQVAILQISGGHAGAGVFVDEKRQGVIQPDGSFQTQVLPGSHSIELRKDTSRSKPIVRRFTERQNTLIPAPDFSFESPLGALRFKVSPPDSRITIRLKNEQESQARPVTQDTLQLAEGSYVVSASAPGRSSAAVTVPVTAGGNAVVELTLREIEAARQTSPVQPFLADWDDPGSWIPDREWYVHKSASFVSYKLSPVNGTFIFTAVVRTGKRLQWALSRTNDKNYILYKLDRNHFERSEILNGKSKEQIRIDRNLTDQPSYTVKIDISADLVEHSLKQSGNWVVIDRWSQAGRAFDKGKFGFVIPWRDEFAVSSFSFSPHVR